MRYLPFCACVVGVVAAKCYGPSPAFPVPTWGKSGPILPRSAFEAIEQLVENAVNGSFKTSSFSVEVTSNTDTLWSYHRSASIHDKERPGVTKVDSESQYRIASITKTFTTLAILYQHAAGNLSLDDSILDHLPELKGKDYGTLPLKDITLRILASQLSGIPREFAFADVLLVGVDPVDFGLPPVSKSVLNPCYSQPGATECDRADLIHELVKMKPIFAPNQQSTYSNLAFDLLGLAIETSTGLNYSTYIEQAIFAPLNMTFASLETPPNDDHAVLPVGGNYWGEEESVQRPTGGIYASSSDMSKYLRYVLTHYNALAKGINWFMPASWSTGMNTFYGMPWEIARSDKILLDSNRPVTLVTKGGALPGYFSIIVMLPEYGLGVTILVGGDSNLMPILEEAVTVPLIRSAEAAIWKNINATIAGAYIATNPSLNSTIALESSPTSGLRLTTFISNSTDFLHDILPLIAGEFLGSDANTPYRIQLTPTLLYKNETTQSGEIWRMLLMSDHVKGKTNVWEYFCHTDVDPLSYAGLPINEVVFWHEEGIVELPAWKVTLRPAKAEERREGLIVQGKGDL
ncbi:hypothetical protein LTR95_003349 [Oleoguttula sp. CCFEE 5521]